MDTLHSFCMAKYSVPLRVGGAIALMIVLLTGYILAVQRNHTRLASPQSPLYATWLESSKVPWHVRPFCDSRLPGCSTPHSNDRSVSLKDELVSFVLGLSARSQLSYTATGAGDWLFLAATHSATTNNSNNATIFMTDSDAQAIDRLLRWDYRAYLQLGDIPLYDADQDTLGLSLGYCSVQGCYLFVSYDVQIVTSPSGDVVRVAAVPSRDSNGDRAVALVRVGQPVPSWSWFVQTVVDPSTNGKDWWQFYAQLQLANGDRHAVPIAITAGVVVLIATTLLTLMSCEHVRGSHAYYEIVHMVKKWQLNSGKVHLSGDEEEIARLSPDDHQRVDNLAHRFKVHINAARSQPRHAHALARILLVGTWLSASALGTAFVYACLHGVWPGNYLAILILIHTASLPLAQLALMPIKRLCCIPSVDSYTTTMDALVVVCGGLLVWIVMANSLLLLSTACLVIVAVEALSFVLLMAFVAWVCSLYFARANNQWASMGTGHVETEGFEGGEGFTDLLILNDARTRSRKLCTRGAVISFAMVTLLTGVQAGYIGWQMASVEWVAAPRQVIVVHLFLMLTWCVATGIGAALSIYVRVVVDETAEWWWHVVAVNAVPFVVFYIIGVIHLLVVWPDELVSTSTRALELFILAVRGFVVMMAAISVSIWGGLLYVFKVLYPSYVDAKLL